MQESCDKLGRCDGALIQSVLQRTGVMRRRCVLLVARVCKVSLYCWYACGDIILGIVWMYAR